MLKDNFLFLNSNYIQHNAIENDFLNKIKGFIKSRFEPATKDGKINHTIQGDTGNCWILSGINALSYTKKGAKIISKSLEYKNGYTIVHTICGDYIVLNSEVNLTKNNNQYSYGDDDMIIFELAFEKIIDDFANKRIRISKNTNYLVKKTLKKTPTTCNNSSTAFGHPGACFYFLTGIEPKVHSTQLKMNECLNKFKDDNLKNIVLCACSCEKFKKRIKDIYGKNVLLYSCHGYAIKKFDGENITVINPHDSSKEIILSKVMFYNMFSNIQSCDLSLKDNIRHYFSPKIYYNKFGKIKKTVEVDDYDCKIQYDYSYNKIGKPTKAKCCAKYQNGLYVICIRDFSKNESIIENGNSNTKIALFRHYSNNKLIQMSFGNIFENNIKIIPPEIGNQIKEYALYQYENLDIDMIISIAKDINDGNFDKAFELCK